MREAVPPMDHLARALLMRGAREPAIMLLKAASRRGGDEKVRCDALLAAVQARPTDRVSGPPISLDAELVEAIAASGRLYEARALALGADLARSVAGVEIAAALEEVFDAYETWPAGWRLRWQDALASGSLPTMIAIEREASVAVDPPAELRNRARIALRLLRGFSLTGATEVREPDGEAPVPVLDEAARGRIAARIAAADLPGALREAHALAFDGVRGAADVAAILGRLVAAAEQAMSEPHHVKLASTVPLGGPAMALFQLRMGNLAESQRLFRSMLLESPGDHLARQQLADLGTLDRALGGGRPQVHAEPPARAPSTDVLDKRARKANVAGWASPKPQHPEIGWDDEDDSTSVMKSDHEAELLLKSGHPERALALYVELCRNFPDRPHFQKRKQEIEAILSQRAPLAIEPTVRRDVSALAQKRPAAIDPLAQTGDSGAFAEGDVPTHVTRGGRGVAELLQPPAAAGPRSPAPGPGVPPVAAAPRPSAPGPAPAPASSAAKSATGTSSPAMRAAVPPSRPLTPGASPIPASRPATGTSSQSLLAARGGAPPPSRPLPSASSAGRSPPRVEDESVSVHRAGELGSAAGPLEAQVTVRKIVPVR